MKSSLRLAPLNGLRAFEAAARHLSFSAAADELFVTPGAISHQIAGLEQLLGVKLFIRGSRSITLTDAAKACLPLLTQGFATLRQAVTILENDIAVPPLTVNVAPAFATRWLLPRLAAFTKAHPDIALRLSTGLELIDAVRQESSSGPSSDLAVPADISIRFGRGVYPGFVSEKLFEAEVSPVCGARLLGEELGETSLDDLRRATLLHHDTAYFEDGKDDWAVWLEAAGLHDIDASRGPRFSHAGLALEAAEDGLGFALGITALTARDILTGRLVAPFDLKLVSNYSYHLVYSDASKDRAELRTFRAWLLAEAARDQVLLRSRSVSTL